MPRPSTPLPIITTTPIPSPNATRRKNSLSHSSYQDTTLLGSYEESILKGRMSSSPSRPIKFHADLGVFGTSHPKCPPHFYSTFDCSHFDDSPFVGCLLIPNFHIPKKGKLQIVIKNPHGTVIKVFLIPYDHSKMPPNSKSVARQKTYAIHNNKSRRLLSAVHLQFLRLGKKLYLHSNVRMVFSSRSADMDERTETTEEHGDSGEFRYVPVDPTQYADFLASIKNSSSQNTSEPDNTNSNINTTTTTTTITTELDKTDIESTNDTTTLDTSPDSLSNVPTSTCNLTLDGNNSNDDDDHHHHPIQLPTTTTNNKTSTTTTTADGIEDSNDEKQQGMSSILIPRIQSLQLEPRVNR